MCWRGTPISSPPSIRRGKSADVVAKAIVTPSADIAQGYESTEIKTKDGLTIEGVLIKEGDPLMMRSPPD